MFAKSRDILKKVASDNIRVNCIAPGIIKTKFAEVTFDHVYFTKWSLFVVVGIVAMQIQNFSFHLDRPWRITMILQRKLWKTCLLAGNVQDKTNPGAFFYFHPQYMKWITNWPIFADLVAQKKWVVLWAFWSPMRWSNCSIRYGAVWILFFWQSGLVESQTTIFSGLLSYWGDNCTGRRDERQAVISHVW